MNPLSDIPEKKNEWIETRLRLPEEGKIVYTKIDEGGKVRNDFVKLKRRANLWFFDDGSMYVYYTPTHWQPLNF